MLSVLHIENIAVIEQAEILFEGGFNVLTGETGAGKSIVIDAISAILGERTYRDVIRTGAQGMIEDLTFEELRALRLEGTDEQIPLFDEALALFEAATPLIIELKSANGNHFALTKAVCERLDTYKGIYCIESFDPFCLLDLKKLRPDTCRGQLSMNFLKDPSGLPLYKRYIAGNLLLNFLTRPDFVAYKYEDRNCLAPRLCRSLWGIQEVSWTLRRREDLLCAERAHAIGIFERFDPDRN